MEAVDPIKPVDSIDYMIDQVDSNDYLIDLVDPMIMIEPIDGCMLLNNSRHNPTLNSIQRITKVFTQCGIYAFEQG